MRVLHLSRNTQLVAVLALAGSVLVWQLFTPPIIGLADQGDFLKLLGPLGYAPVPKGSEHKYSYVTRQYVKDPSYREPRWEQPTSELLIARVAVTIHNLTGNPERFDITLFGLIHAALFLLALTRLLYVTKDLPLYGLTWALVCLVMTDVGYVAYWNSLYTEPASCLWFLFFLAESISICTSRRLSLGPILRWNVFAVLWITAKTQNAALCVPLAVYGLAMILRTRDSKIRLAFFVGAMGICSAGVMMHLSPASTGSDGALRCDLQGNSAAVA